MTRLPANLRSEVVSLQSRLQQAKIQNNTTIMFTTSLLRFVKVKLYSQETHLGHHYSSAEIVQGAHLSVQAPTEHLHKFVSSRVIQLVCRAALFQTL